MAWVFLILALYFIHSLLFQYAYERLLSTEMTKVIVFALLILCAVSYLRFS